MGLALMNILVVSSFSGLSLISKMKMIQHLMVYVGVLLVANPLSAAENVIVSGELKQWHKVTLTVDGPEAREADSKPNPFTDLKLDVRFTHESGSPDYLIPGYFAADGNAAESSAMEGNKWRVHLSPDKAGRWKYAVSFKGSKQDGATGNFVIKETDKKGIDLRAKGRLQYVGKRYLRHAGSGEWFLKAGADSPETFLAYADFDGTEANKPKKCPLKTWQPHVKDWNSGDPTWKNGKGKGMIGAINGALSSITPRRREYICISNSKKLRMMTRTDREKIRRLMAGSLGLRGKLTCVKWSLVMDITLH
jgi:hypothetical protein